MSKTKAPQYFATEVRKVRQRRTRQLIRRFNLTIRWDAERSLTLKGCIVGHSQHGPYAFKGSLYRDVQWSRVVQDDVLRGFSEAGLLADLLPQPNDLWEGEQATPDLEWSI